MQAGWNASDRFGESCPRCLFLYPFGTDNGPCDSLDGSFWGRCLFMAGRTVTKDTNKVHIRWMIRRDMLEVLKTELASFEYAWTEDDFLRCLRQRNCIGMVAEVNDRVIGFMIYELHKSRLHILNFAVAPNFRRKRIGAQMVRKLMGKLSSHRRSKITLAVRERNLEAQLFFRKQDFRAMKVLRNYYEDSGEDAFLMEYRVEEELTDFSSPVNRIAQFEES
jgi:[ribosomal protein S18]-alanine N-acetyltransferase